jgi:SulP family sulfate permease
LIIDGESINNIDSTAIHALEEIVSDFKSRNISVYFTGIKGPVRDKLLKSGFIKKTKPDHFFMSIQEAVDYFDTDNKKEVDENNFRQYINQTNK